MGSPTLLELFMLPNVKQRLILTLTTMHMDLEAMVLDTESILMDMAIILDTLPLAMVMVLDMDMVMDTMDNQKNKLIDPQMNEMSSMKPISIVHSVNDPLFRSGDKIFTFHQSFLALIPFYQILKMRDLHSPTSTTTLMTKLETVVGLRPGR